LGGVQFLKELNVKTKDALLSKYLNYAINALSSDVKSREEIFEELTSANNSASLDTASVGSPSMDSFNVNASPSPSQFHNIFKTPNKQGSSSALKLSLPGSSSLKSSTSSTTFVSSPRLSSSSAAQEEKKLEF